MKKLKHIIPLFLIIISLIGLFIAIYLVMSEEPTEIRKKAAGARTVTVCASGCDRTDINQAFANAQEGDTIFINTDIYDSAGVISRSSGWTFKLPDSIANITIKGKGKDATIWKLSSTSPMGHILHIESLNNVKITIKDLAFSQNSQTNSIIHIYGTDTNGNPDTNANSNCEFTFENVKVTDSKAAGIYISGSNKGFVKNSYFSGNEWPGVSVHGAAEVNIENSKFENHQHQGVDVKDNSNVEITSCEFLGNNIKWDEKDQNNNTYTSGSIHFYNHSKGNITKNSFLNNKGTSIKIGKGGYGEITDYCEVNIKGNNISNSLNGSGIHINGNSIVSIKNNIIINNNKNGINTINNANTSIINNTIVNNNEAGVLMWDNANVTVRNNIIVDNKTYGGITGWHFTGTVSISYNEVWHNYKDNQENNYLKGENTTTDIIAGTGDISQDPKFVSSSDFHLQSGSPAINAGDPDPIYNDPDGSRNDIGAYGGPNSTQSNSQCKNADLWGDEDKPDGIVNMFDLSKVLGKWKQSNVPEDISGPNQVPDGIVNLWDVIKITQSCWRKSV